MSLGSTPAFSFGGAAAGAPAPAPAKSGFFFGTGASGTSTPGPAPTFSFGAAAPAPATPATGFSFGGAQSTGGSASKPPVLSFGTSPAPAAPALSFGATPAPAATTLSFGAAPAPAAPTLSFSAAPAPMAPMLSFGAAPAPTTPALSFGATPAPAVSTLSFGSAPAPSGALSFGTAGGQQNADPPAALRNKTIEEIISSWKRELESDLLSFETQVDRLRCWENEIRAAQREIIEVTEYAERLVVAQQQTERVLSDVRNYQDELDQTLERVERAVDQHLARASVRTGPNLDADQTREQIYDLAVKLETQLDAMLAHLKQLVNQLNRKHETALADPNSREIMKILNAHHHSIAFLNAKAAAIDQNVSELELKLPN